MVDKVYAMSSFLQFRMVYDKSIGFSKEYEPPKSHDTNFKRTPIHNSEELNDFLKETVDDELRSGNMALALSGGIDSAILAKFVPKGTVAYTFRCIVPGKKVVDETVLAKQYCDINNLKHKIIDIYWEDYEQYAPVLMKSKRAPVHSIEVQIYKASLQARKDGFNKFLFGELADTVYGGLNQILSKDYIVGDFIDRYSCVLPYKVLKDSVIITEPFTKHTQNGYVDVHAFFNDVFFDESFNSYKNACETADIEFTAPYSLTFHKPLDLERVRRGENKYLVRELFQRLYPDLEIPPKTPMPRPMNEWFENWEGPKRPEFLENCHVNMTGDQKYYIWILEKFLNEFKI